MADNEAAINNVVLTLKYLVIIPAQVGTRSDDKPVKILKANSCPVDFILSLVKSYIKVFDVIINSGVVRIWSTLNIIICVMLVLIPNKINCIVNAMAETFSKK